MHGAETRRAFVDAARRRSDKATEAVETAAEDRTEEHLATIAARLAQIEQTLETLVAGEPQTRPRRPAT